MNYAKQPRPPEWWDAKKEICLSATLGNSPHNEWYFFADRTEATKWIISLFDSQTYHDNFTVFNNEIYYTEDMLWKEDDTPTVKNTATPADLQDVINAESRF